MKNRWDLSVIGSERDRDSCLIRVGRFGGRLLSFISFRMTSCIWILMPNGIRGSKKDRYNNSSLRYHVWRPNASNVVLAISASISKKQIHLFEQIQIVEWSFYKTRSMKPSFLVHQANKRNKESQSPFFIHCQFKLGSEDFKGIYNLGHPAGVMNCPWLPDSFCSRLFTTKINDTEL